MVEMTMIEALEKLAELNNYEEILVKTNAGEPQAIEYAIEDVRNHAEDLEKVFDLRVTEDTIREYDENGYIKCGEALYNVVREEELDFDSLNTSDIVIDALQEISRNDNTKFMQLWIDGYTKIHSADEITQIVKNYIKQRVKPEDLEEFYSWGIEKIWMFEEEP